MSKAQEWVDKKMSATRAWQESEMRTPSFMHVATVRPEPYNGDFAPRLYLQQTSLGMDMAIEFAKWILATFEEPK